MTNSGGGGTTGILGSVGDSGGIFLDDADNYSIAFIAGVAKELTEANSVGAATPLNEGPVSGIVTANGPSGSLTINKAGLYEVSLASSFSADGSVNIEGAVYKNGVRNSKVSFGVDISNPNTLASVAPSCVIRISDVDLPAVLTSRFIFDANRTLAINHFSLHVVGAGK